MMSVAELREATPEDFERSAENWARHVARIRVVAAGLELQVRALAPWLGEAGDAARAQLRLRHDQLVDAADVTSRIPPALRVVAARVRSAQQQLLAALKEAAALDMAVSAEGAVAYGQGQQRTATGLAAVMRRAVADATHADAEATAALARAMPAVAGLQALGPAPTGAQGAIPRPGTSPLDVKQWWDSLSPMQQESLLFTDPARIGCLDGIPAIARDRANRAELAEAQARLRQRQGLLRAGGADRTDTENDELADITDRMRGIEAIQTRLTAPVSSLRQQAFLLDFDAGGKGGRAVVAAGNPDTADNVVTAVPGTGSRLGEVGGHLTRSDRLLESASRADRSQSTSAITWIGYDAPQDLGDGTSGSYADAARKDLHRFQLGLSATDEGDPARSTLLGHSYGSTVIGHTARDGGGLAVDQVIFIGSPGVGVDRAGELGIPQENVWSSTAENDAIRMAPEYLHGTDPGDYEFGGQHFTSDPGQEDWYGYSYAAHSQYWDPRSASLENMGRVIVGQQPVAR